MSEAQHQQTIKQIDAAERFGVSERTIRRWEKAKLIQGRRIRGVKLYRIEQLEKLAGLR